MFNPLPQNTGSISHVPHKAVPASSGVTFCSTADLQLKAKHKNTLSSTVVPAYLETLCLFSILFLSFHVL